MYFDMFFILMLLARPSCYYTSVIGQHRLNGSSQPVLAIVGDDVILPCHVVDDPPRNMERETVLWTKLHLKPPHVYVLQDGRHNTSPVNLAYKRRTFLSRDGLSRGNISLRLSGVKLSDQGTYKCDAPRFGSIEIQLRVRQPRVMAIEGGEAILPCRITPPANTPISTVQWTTPDGRRITATVNPSYKQRVSLFAENNSLKLSRVNRSDEGTYHCSVPNLDISTSILLLVGLASQPVISTNRSTDGGLLLTCDSGCWFPRPEMYWLDGHGNNITAESPVRDGPSHHCYEVYSNVTVTVTQATNLTCRVHLPHYHTAEAHHYIKESDIPRERINTLLLDIPSAGESTGRVRPAMIVTVVTVAVALGSLIFLKEEKARRHRAAKFRGLLERTSGYRHITDYEDELQRNLSVKLGTQFKTVFTPLYNVDINVTDIHSHVIQMDMKKAGEGTEIQLGEINKFPSGSNMRTELTVGYEGIGKTFLVQKFVSDWAKKCFPQDPHLVFLLKFHQLNLLKGQTFSLAQLIHCCIAETIFIEEDILSHIFNALQNPGDCPFKVMFVMDGYDQNNFQFNFKKDFGLMNVNNSYPVEDILVNLIKGNLLPSARIWITSQRAAASQIPIKFVNRMTEIRGFIKDDQKEEFFTKMFSDKKQAKSIFSHIKTSKILRTMCEIPVFCWIFATVVKNIGTTAKLPKTLVELFCHFLMGETLRENPALDEAGEVLLKLGRLAFDQLDKGKTIFYENDLKVCGLEVNKDLKNLGFFTKFFKEEHIVFKEDYVSFSQTVYCFVHLRFQEFLAAVYLFQCFTQKNIKVLKTFLEDDDYNSDSSLSDFLKAAMKKTLQSESGHLDTFVRFLHGLSMQSNQSLFGGLLGQTENSPEEIQRAINNLKEMNDFDASPDRRINISHCLMELSDGDEQPVSKSGDPIVPAHLESHHRVHSLPNLQSVGYTVVQNRRKRIFSDSASGPNEPRSYHL